MKVVVVDVCCVINECMVKIWTSFEDGKDYFVFVFDVGLLVLHVSAQAVTQIFLFQKPTHELSEHLWKSGFLLNVHRQGFGPSEVLLLHNDVLNELLIVSPMELTDAVKFGAVSLLLDDFHSFLANVEANVLGCYTFGLEFLCFLFFNCLQRVLWLLLEKALGSRRSWLEVDELRTITEGISGHSHEVGRDEGFLDAIGVIFFEEEFREDIEGVILGRIEKRLLCDERVKVKVCVHRGSSF